MPSSEAIWYYAQDDREHGPVSAAYIAGMARTGKLRPEDLVWREGMEDWRPARSIKGLFTPVERASGAASDTAVLDSPFDAVPPTTAPEPTSDVETPGRAAVGAGAAAAATQPAPPPVDAHASGAAEFDAGAPSAVDAVEFPATDLLAASPGEARLAAEIYQRAGRTVMIVGLLLALLTRGCDLAADRSVARLEAKAALAQDLAARELPQQEATGAGSQSSAPVSAAAEEATRLAKAAREAHLNNQAWAFWRAVCFLVGAVLFTAGLLPLALAGSGADRWLGIALLAAIVFAVFSHKAP
jgi:hypothetical protein